MSKSFLILVFLVLFGSHSDHVAGQATSDKSRPQTNIQHPKDPINSDPTAKSVTKEPNAEAKELYREGMKLTEAGQFSQAAEYLQQAVRLDQEYAEAYSALGRAYFKMREWQKAAVNLRRAVELRKHQAPQGAVDGKVLVQELKEAKPQMKIGATIQHTTQGANANAAELKPVRPESTRQVKPRQEAKSTVQTDRSTPAINPLQETRANVAAVRPRDATSETIKQPAPRETIRTPEKVTTTSPQIRPQQQTNAGVRQLESEATRQPEKRVEANKTPAKVIPLNSQSKPPQETSTNAAAVRPLSPPSETTKLEQRQEVSTPAKVASTNSQTELPQATDADTAGVKAVIPKLESETTPQTVQPEEVSSPAKSTPAIPEIKLPQEIKASAAGVKPPTPESPTPRSQEKSEEASTSVRAAVASFTNQTATRN